ncbi:mCG148450 [Mus musculus]|nr:mCG148450 [Mus musculus]
MNSCQGTNSNCNVSSFVHKAAQLSLEIRRHHLLIAASTSVDLCHSCPSASCSHSVQLFWSTHSKLSFIDSEL